MDREKALDKIQKLLAIGRRSNHQAEAETALAQAQRLMLAHNIEVGEIDSAEVGCGGEWVFEAAWTGSRRPVEAKFLTPILSEFFFVRVLVSRLPYRIELFGESQNVAMARYVWVFLSRTFRDLWREHKRFNARTESDRQAYYWGLEQGFSQKLRREREAAIRAQPQSENALMVVTDRLDAELENHCPILRTRRTRIKIGGSGMAIEAGRRDGASINLRTPIAGESNQPRRLGLVG